MSVLNHLNQLKSEAIRLGEGYDRFASRAEELIQRLRSGEFVLAVLGQFKRGKSSLLNALVGMDVLPVSLAPLTAIPTFLRHGQEIRVAVHHEDGNVRDLSLSSMEEARDVLRTYGTEEGNPKNRLGVSKLEVWLPSPILAHGITFVDTPGIGSTYTHNTQTTLEFLPSTDGAIFVLSPDPPITEVERSFVLEVAQRVPSMIFVMTKADRFGGDELEEALAFLRSSLDEMDIDAPEIFVVSSRQFVTTGTNPGMERLNEYLIEFAASRKGDALVSAVEMKCRQMVAQFLNALEVEERALVMPLEELREASLRLDELTQDLERERAILHDVLEGDHRRTLQWLDSRASELAVEVESALERVVFDSISGVQPSQRERAAREVLAREVPPMFDSLTDRFTSEVSGRVTATLEEHSSRLMDLLERAQKEASRILGATVDVPTPEGTVERIGRPYWATHKWSSVVYPFPTSLLEGLLPPRMRQDRQDRRIREHVQAVVLKNMETIRWALYQAVNRAFWRFGSMVDEAVGEAVRATRGAVEHALRERAENADVHTRLAAIRSAQDTLARLGV